MAEKPSYEEWDTSLLPAFRRAYLDAGHTFEDIARSATLEAEVLKLWIEPYRNPPERVVGARQACFRIHVSNKTYDLLYNAPDGIRGRYWQSPAAGDLATRFLINSLEPALLGFAEKEPPITKSGEVVSLTEVRASLRSVSAKVWVREKDDTGSTKITLGAGSQLRVRRWEQNEPRCGNKGALWRWTPCENEIEIKGALLDPTGFEYIPEIKQNRSNDIHLFGFT